MDQMAQHGRYGDTMLVHMNPVEVAGIAALSPTGKLTTNPVTGQPEAFLPLLFGALGGALKLGTLGTAALSGIGTAAVTGDLKRGLLAGVTSGLTAGIGEAFAGADAASGVATTGSEGLQSVVDSGGDIMGAIGAGEVPASAMTAAGQAGVGAGTETLSALQAGAYGVDGTGNIVSASAPYDAMLTGSAQSAANPGLTVADVRQLSSAPTSLAGTPADPTISQQLFGGAENFVNRGIGSLGTSGQLVGAMTAEGMSQQMQTQQDFERQQRAMREESEAKRRQANEDLQGAYAMAQPGLQPGYSPYRSMMSRNTPPPMYASQGGVVRMNEGGIVPTDEEARVLALAGNQGILGSEDQMTLESYYNRLNTANAAAIEDEAAAEEAANTAANTLFIPEGATNKEAFDLLNGAGLIDGKTNKWFQRYFQESAQGGTNVADGKFFSSESFPGTEEWLATTDFAESSKNYIRNVLPLIQQGATTGIPLSGGEGSVEGIVAYNPFGTYYGGAANAGYGGLDPVQVQANLRGKEAVSAPRDYMTGFEPEFSYYQEDASRPITPDRSYRPTSQQLDSTGEYFDPIINREEYLQQIKDYYTKLGGYKPDEVDPVKPVDPVDDKKPGDPCEMDDGTPGVINNSGVCEVKVTLPLGGQPCTMADGSPGTTDDDGICQYDNNPGDQCALPDGSTGVIDDNRQCVSTGGPKPGDSCSIDGKAGTLDENLVCQIPDDTDYGGYGDPLTALSGREIKDYLARMLDIEGVDAYSNFATEGSLSGQEQGAQAERSRLIVRDLFYRYLGREPDDEGLKYYAEELAKTGRRGVAGERALRDIADEIMGSEEGQNYAAGIRDGAITPPDRTKPDYNLTYTDIDKWMAGESGSQPMELDTTPDEDGYLSAANYRDIDEFLHRRRDLLYGVNVLMGSKKSVSASDLNDLIASQPTRYGGQMVYNPETGRLYEGVSSDMSQSEQDAFYENLEELRDKGHMPQGIDPALYTQIERERGAGLMGGTTGTTFIRVGNEQYFVDPSDNSVVSYTVRDIEYDKKPSFAGGGTVPLRTPVGNAEVVAGGIANVPTEFSASMPTEQEFNMIKDAILGRIDNADAVVDMFVKKYGPEMFQQLRNMLLRSSQPQAQTEGMIRGNGSGMDDEVPGMIGDQQPVAVSPGEFIVPADVVSGLGDGSSDAGAKELDRMMDRVRMDRNGTTKQAPSIDARKAMPI
jgi:hypothetical protein